MVLFIWFLKSAQKTGQNLASQTEENHGTVINSSSKHTANSRNTEHHDNLQYQQRIALVQSLYHYFVWLLLKSMTLNKQTCGKCFRNVLLCRRLSCIPQNTKQNWRGIWYRHYNVQSISTVHAIYFSTVLLGSKYAGKLWCMHQCHDSKLKILSTITSKMLHFIFLWRTRLWLAYIFWLLAMDETKTNHHKRNQRNLAVSDNGCANDRCWMWVIEYNRAVFIWQKIFSHSTKILGTLFTSTVPQVCVTDSFPPPCSSTPNMPRQTSNHTELTILPN